MLFRSLFSACSPFCRVERNLPQPLWRGEWSHSAPKSGQAASPASRVGLCRVGGAGGAPLPPSASTPPPPPRSKVTLRADPLPKEQARRGPRGGQERVKAAAARACDVGLCSHCSHWRPSQLSSRTKNPPEPLKLCHTREALSAP